MRFLKRLIGLRFSSSQPTAYHTQYLFKVSDCRTQCFSRRCFDVFCFVVRNNSCFSIRFALCLARANSSHFAVHHCWRYGRRKKLVRSRECYIANFGMLDLIHLLCGCLFAVFCFSSQILDFNRCEKTNNLFERSV